MVSGGTVNWSILSTHVRVGGRTVIDDSILLDGVLVNEGALLKNDIFDMGVEIVFPIDAGRSTTSENGVDLKTVLWRFRMAKNPGRFPRE